MGTDNIIWFEQPLNERIRTFLRLEFLFAQLLHHRQDASCFGTRSTMQSMLDILALLTRSDIKGDILKELTTQKDHLSALSNTPGVDTSKLDEALDELNRIINNLQKSRSKFTAGKLREHAFLNGIQNRLAIQGGTSPFDLPGYHHWLNSDTASVQQTLDRWLNELTPYENGINLHLNLIRKSTAPREEQAQAGMYIHSFEQPCQVLRIGLDQNSNAYPEISAGRHRATIRFLAQTNVDQRDAQSKENVPFLLAGCVL